MIAAFLCGGFCIHSATRFASAAPNERTATAHVFSVEHHVLRYFRFDFYSCGYNFSVDGSFYIEDDDCPRWIADDAAKGKYSGSTLGSTIADATVYYDSADPSVNSLLAFSVASENYYWQAVTLIGVGALIIVYFVFGAVLRANQGAKRGVDAGEAVAYPGQLGFAHPPELRDLYLQVVNRIHPDRAWNEADRVLRERLMKEANAAFKGGDADALRGILEQYRERTSVI